MTARYSLSDPHPYYAALAEAGPVHRVSMPNGGKAWFVTRFEEAKFVLADERFSMQPTDGEEVRPDRLRPRIAPLFGAGRVAELKPLVESIVNGLLDEMAPRGQAELIGDFALSVPMGVICEVLGVPPSDRAMFRAWADVIIAPKTVPSDVYGTAVAATREYVRGWVKAEQIGLDLSEEELLALSFVFLTAGYDTVAGAIGNGLLALLRNPDELHRLRNDPGLFTSAVEELLRTEGPTERTPRYAITDVRIGRAEVRRGDSLIVAHNCANRDPRRFTDPQRTDIGRREGGHLAFGHGIHRCLGFRLAKLQITIALRGLLDRFPSIQLAGEPEWHSGMVLRHVKRLPIRWDV